MEPDTKSKTSYEHFEKTIRQWCQPRYEQFGIDKDDYWCLKEMLNIWPEGRTVCDGESGSFLIDSNTREKAVSDCGFALLCEKKMVSRELLARTNWMRSTNKQRTSKGMSGKGNRAYGNKSKRWMKK